MRIAAHRAFPIFCICAASIFWLAFFISGARKAAHGAWVAPLDDTFIHFQYAKEIAHGHWFRYAPHAPVTMGDTSFLYPILLSAGYAIGFAGLKLLWFAYGLAALCLAGTGYICFLLALSYRIPRGIALLISMLVISNGWLLWGYFSGMEIALQAFVLLMTLISARTEVERGALTWFPLWGTILALIRPEGFITVCIIAFWIVAQKWYCKQPIRRWYLACVPLIAFAGQLGFYRAATGQWSSNTFIAKTWWYNISDKGPSSVALINKLLQLSIVWFYFLPKELALFANDIGLVPYAGVAVFLAGAVAARHSERARTRFPLSLVWLIIFAVEFAALLNIYGVIGVARRRYFIFLAPLVIFYTLYLAHAATAHREKWLRATVWIFFTALTLVNAYMFRGFYALDNQNIYEMHYMVADWIEKNTAPGDIIAMNDAGIVPYLTDRPFFDVMGLVTNRVAEVLHQGPKAYFSFLATLPVSERPAYFIIFPGWFDSAEKSDPLLIHRFFKLLGPPIHEFLVSNYSITPFSAMSVFKPKW